MVKVPTLDDWCIHFGALSGIVRGSAAFDDGQRIVTTRLATVHGRRVVTQNGSVYQLLAPSDDQRSMIKVFNLKSTKTEPLAFWGDRKGPHPKLLSKAPRRARGVPS